jgi:hypothetical protein
MKFHLVALTIIAALVPGCGDSSKPGTPANEVSNAVTAPVGYLGAVVEAKKYSEKQIDLAYINQAIQQFQVGEGRLPKSLQELVDEKYLGKIPEPPYGYKIVYDPAAGAVSVVKQ